VKVGSPFPEGAGLLVVGGDAMIGYAMIREADRRGVPCWWTTRRPPRDNRALPLDLVEPPVAFAPPRGARVVVLVAAQARLQACEDDPALAARINVDAVRVLAHRFAALGLRVLLLSTSQVHQASRIRRGETAPPSPVNEYGRQKVRAEGIVTALPGGAVLRLTKVLEPDNALLSSWLAEMGGGRPIHPFHDMMMAPVSLAAAVDVILALAAQASAQGIYQFSASHDISYADAARYLARRGGWDEQRVMPRSFRDAGLTPVLAPAVTAMDVCRLSDALGIGAPAPEAALDAFLVARRNAISFPS